MAAASSEALSAAVIKGSATEVDALLKQAPSGAGAAACSSESLAVLSETSDLGPGVALLHVAAAKGHADVAALLLAAGAQPAALDEGGMCALHYAASEGHLAVVSLLAPSAECPELLVEDKYQMTPFHFACENGHDEVVAHLLVLLEAAQSEGGGVAAGSCAAGGSGSSARARAAGELRRGSALFLAQKGGTASHKRAVDLIEGTTPLPTPMSSARCGPAAATAAADGNAAASAAAAAAAAAAATQNR